MPDLPSVPCETGEATSVQAAEGTLARRRGRPRKPKPQAYPDYVQEVLYAFLNERREQAVKAIQAADVLLAISPGMKKGQADMEYWTRIVQAIDWITWFVDKRQKHLTSL